MECHQRVLLPKKDYEAVRNAFSRLPDPYKEATHYIACELLDSPGWCKQYGIPLGQDTWNDEAVAVIYTLQRKIHQRAVPREVWEAIRILERKGVFQSYPLYPSHL